MATPAVLTPKKVDVPTAPVHLEPAGPVPQGYFEAFLQWIQNLVASLGELLLPTLSQERIQILPNLPKIATFETFSKFVYHEVGSRIERADREISNLANTDPSKLDEKMTQVAEIISLTSQANGWLACNQRAFKAKGLEAVHISRELQKVDEVVQKLLSRIPITGGVLEPAPPNWTPLPLKSPGLENHGNDCFMNACLQMVFGDPMAYKWIAQNPRQHPLIKQLAFKYRHACIQKTQAPLNMAQAIRDLYPEIRGYDQHEAHRAFVYLYDNFTGTDLGVKNNDSHFKERREYERGNPFVHILNRASTFDTVNLENVEEERLTSFQGNINKSQWFEWCPIIPLEGKQQSQAIESIFENFFTPFEGLRQRFNFKMKDGSEQEVESSQEHITFEKCPDRFFFNLKRHSGKMVGNRYIHYRVQDPIEIGETLYLSPKYVKNGEGGKYAVTSFTCHSGSISSSGNTGGHYYSYRRVLDQETKEYYWIQCNDRSSVRVSLETVLQDLRMKADLVLVERIEKHLSPEQIERGVEENVARAKAIKLREKIKSATAKLPEGNTLRIKEKHLERVASFEFLLGEEDISSKELAEVFKATPPDFQDFVKKFLKLTGKIENENDALKSLKELKTIVKPYLTTKVQGNIVAQYHYIRKQQIQLAKDKIKHLKAAQQAVETGNTMSESKESHKSVLLQTEAKESQLNFLISISGDTSKDLLLFIGDFLIHDLSADILKLTNIEEGTGEPLTIPEALEHLLLRTKGFKEIIQSQEELFASLDD